MRTLCKKYQFHFEMSSAQFQTMRKRRRKYFHIKPYHKGPLEWTLIWGGGFKRYKLFGLAARHFNLRTYCDFFRGLTPSPLMGETSEE